MWAEQNISPGQAKHFFLGRLLDIGPNLQQGPHDLGRIDKPEKNIPGSQWHAHDKGKKKGALNVDGTVHDKHKGAPDFSGKTKKWLQSYGWQVKRK